MSPHLLATAVGVLVAGAVSGATGIALPLIAGPVFLLVYQPVEAVALTALCSITGQLFSIALLRRSIDFEFRLPMIPAGLLGVPIGTAALIRLGPSIVHVSLGLLIALSGIWGLARPTAQKPKPLVGGRGEFLVGLVGGLTGGSVGASAVIPSLWCTWRGLGKEQQRAIVRPFILVMQLGLLALLGAWGWVRGSLLSDYASVLLPLLIGVGGGVACFRMCSSAIVTRAVLSLVTLSGIALLMV